MAASVFSKLQPRSTRTQPTTESQTMRNDTAASGEFRINLPPDVLAEMRRNTGNARSGMQVDGFRLGLFGRLLKFMTGGRNR
jgi:hypothetical protein